MLETRRLNALLDSNKQKKATIDQLTAEGKDIR